MSVVSFPVFSQPLSTHRRRDFLEASVALGHPQGMSRYKYTFPSLFSLLLSPQEETVLLGLCLAKEAWDTISAADVEAKVNHSVKAALASVTWAGDVFVREVLLLLAQHSFAFVCPPARTMICDAFDGCRQTAVCENANGACRDRQRDNKNLKMSRLTSYMFLVTREVLAEFKFPEVSISEAERTAPTSQRSLPDLCFSASGCTPSIDEQDLLRITSTRTWASPTPQCEELSVGAWCLLKELAAAGGWGAPVRAWKAAVIPEMSLLRRTRDSACYLVLCSTTWGGAWCGRCTWRRGAAKPGSAWATPSPPRGCRCAIGRTSLAWLGSRRHLVRPVAERRWL